MSSVALRVGPVLFFSKSFLLNRMKGRFEDTKTN